MEIVWKLIDHKCNTLSEAFTLLYFILHTFAAMVIQKLSKLKG
jgi:hypothetical protein